MLVVVLLVVLLVVLQARMQLNYTIFQIQFAIAIAIYRTHHTLQRTDTYTTLDKLIKLFASKISLSSLLVSRMIQFVEIRQ